MYTLELAVQYFRSTWPVQAARSNGRIEKARALVEKGDCIFSTADEQVFRVRSETISSVFYRVHTGERSCNCPDAANGNICKHRLAVWMYRKITNVTIERDQEAIAQARDAQAAAFEAFKAAHPGAVNVHTSALLTIYPRHGHVVYNHPQQGQITVEVLASQERVYANIALVDVLALTGQPFCKHIFKLDSITMPAFCFTPSD